MFIVAQDVDHHYLFTEDGERYLYNVNFEPRREDDIDQLQQDLVGSVHLPGEVLEKIFRHVNLLNLKDRRVDLVCQHSFICKSILNDHYRLFGYHKTGDVVRKIKYIAQSYWVLAMIVYNLSGVACNRNAFLSIMMYHEMTWLYSRNHIVKPFNIDSIDIQPIRPPLAQGSSVTPILLGDSNYNYAWLFGQRSEGVCDAEKIYSPIIPLTILGPTGAVTTDLHRKSFDYLAQLLYIMYNSKTTKVLFAAGSVLVDAFSNQLEFESDYEE